MDYMWIISLAVSCILGAIIGVDREIAHKDAGIRTNTIVCVAACLVVLAGESFEITGQARIAAQVVSGVGFLGAGVILTKGEKVQGLTTAATLWFSACIGIACAKKETILMAIVATIGLLLVLRIISWAEYKFLGKQKGE